MCDNGAMKDAPNPDRGMRKPIEEMTAEELRALVAEMRQRTLMLNEEMRVLQEQIDANQARIQGERNRNGNTERDGVHGSREGPQSCPVR